LGGALPYAYLPFMLIGMIANTMYQGTITGVTNLVEERENDFTAELFVAPISRYSVLLGKIVGAGIASLIALVGIIAMVFVMQIPMNFGDLLRVIALRRSSPSPAARSASSSSASSTIRRRRRRRGPPDLPADLPVRGADPGRELDGAPGLLAKLMPMTYSIDLARTSSTRASPRRHSPCSTRVARPRHHGRLLPGLHDRRDVPLRPLRPEPLGARTAIAQPAADRGRFLRPASGALTPAARRSPIVRRRLAAPGFSSPLSA
jgi:hypothetical protein